MHPIKSFAATCRRVDVAQTGGDRSLVDDHCRRATVCIYSGSTAVVISTTSVGSDQPVCMSVCLCVQSGRISKKSHLQISPNFLCMLPVAVARSSSDDIATRYVFPVLWMTSWGQWTMYQSQKSSTTSCLVQFCTGGEVCRLQLHFV